MCCFTDIVQAVSGTRIYARLRGAQQVLVYQMTYAAANELAMVLPLPVAHGTDEDAVRFIDLEGCETLFDDLAAAFSFEGNDDVEALAMVDDSVATTLRVQRVGAYEASFVPRAQDFGRLDERFRLPLDLWTGLGAMADYGFAVFKLRESRMAQAHPMAFTFPTRHPDRLFFPTLHIHHRDASPMARFDHELYCQPEPAMNWHLADWQESDAPVNDYVKCGAARDLFDLDYPCWRATISGYRRNTDSWLGAGVGLPTYR